ncbi:hypothetical protein CKA32_002385 [Geitlerinema sp. FC II]|nr:hypothetical protein CKA32_002385 [Geitlerinema sp. FC II]
MGADAYPVRILTAFFASREGRSIASSIGCDRRFSASTIYHKSDRT